MITGKEGLIDLISLNASIPFPSGINTSEIIKSPFPSLTQRINVESEVVV